jgi:nicotinic acid mononucleotide adenylyltransferase
MELPDFSKIKGVFPDERLAQLQSDIIETPLIDISSTDIRIKLAAGQSVDDMLSPNVIDYIKQNRLYLSKR